MRRFKTCLWLLVPMTALVSSCGIYSFSGTSIKPDVKTCEVEYFVNKAMQVNPSLANDLTEALIDKYNKLTTLDMVTDGGDLTVYGEILTYDLRPMAVTADEVASQTRLTIGIKLYYTNRLHPEEDFEKNFSAYQDFDSNQSFDAVESTLVYDIIEILVEDIFNATVANW